MKRSKVINSNLITPERAITPDRILSLRSRDILYSTSRKIKSRRTRTPRTNQTPMAAAAAEVAAKAVPATVMVNRVTSRASHLEPTTFEVDDDFSKERERAEVEVIVRQLNFSHDVDMDGDDDNNNNTAKRETKKEEREEKEEKSVFGLTTSNPNPSTTQNIATPEPKQQEPAAPPAVPNSTTNDTDNASNAILTDDQVMQLEKPLAELASNNDNTSNNNNNDNSFSTPKSGKSPANVSTPDNQTGSNIVPNNNDEEHPMQIDDNIEEEEEHPLPQLTPYKRVNTGNTSRISSTNVSVSDPINVADEQVMPATVISPLPPLSSPLPPSNSQSNASISVNEATPKTRIPSLNVSPFTTQSTNTSINVNASNDHCNTSICPDPTTVSPLRSTNSFATPIRVETDNAPTVAQPIDDDDVIIGSDNSVMNASSIADDISNSINTSLSATLFESDIEMQEELEETLNLCRRADVDLIVSKKQDVCARTRENKINNVLSKFLLVTISLTVVFFGFYNSSNNLTMEKLFNNFAGLSLVLSFNMLLLFIFKKFQRVNITVDERLDYLLTERTKTYNRCLRLSEIANGDPDSPTADAFISEKNKLEDIENEIVSFYKIYYSH